MNLGRTAATPRRATCNGTQQGPALCPIQGPAPIAQRAVENHVPSVCTAGRRRPRRAAVLQKVCTSSTARAAAPERLSRAQPPPPAPLTALTAFVRAGAAHGLRALACPRARASRGMGAAAWKRVELQEELHSGAGAVAWVDSHDAVPAGHGRQCGSPLRRKTPGSDIVLE
eukprot:CAMPEP_0202757422 /NCGR_PEP_ID=MMETSP1388-20130828/16358_1 /ASSEMBLY_ACC=CAM_ASM_000864 /TAXON_ID=37098 /ORGANISM="Isochrysis sp, Strain CCMP1244" /LENGTH=170 /DNA_ID=CAMNT_0049425313 /DNA_START=39 /DNA_END=555 /DNA_ORIENTATION=-